MVPTENNYIDGIGLTSSTSTWREPSRQEAIDEIVINAIKLANAKWYEDKSRYKYKIKFYQEFIGYPLNRN